MSISNVWKISADNTTADTYLVLVSGYLSAGRLHSTPWQTRMTDGIIWLMERRSIDMYFFYTQ